MQNQSFNPVSSDVGYKQIENEHKILGQPQLQLNGLLRLQFEDGRFANFHPDCLYGLMDEYEDEDGIVWPLDDYEDDGPDDGLADEEEVIGDDTEEEEIDPEGQIDQ